MKDSPLRLGITLMIIAGLMGLILGATNVLTKDTITAEKEKAEMASFEAVLPNSGTLTELDIPESFEGEVLRAYRAQNGGYCLQVANKGYGGAVKVAVGLNAQAEVTGIMIVEHAESAGLGANAAKPEFGAQYVGKNVEISVVKANAGENQINAISGATITSRCVTKSVNTAIRFVQWQAEGGQANG